MQQKNKIKTIFFDVYQTLQSINDTGNDKSWHVFSDYLNDNNVKCDALEFRKLVNLENQKYYQKVDDVGMKTRHHDLSNSINNVFLNHNVAVEKNDLLDLIWEFRSEYASDLEIYPGVESMLEKLFAKYFLSTASYTQGSYTRKELEKLKIAQYFSSFVFSSDIGYRKTDPKFFEICLEKTENKPVECVMVGDNYLQDVVSSKTIGLKAVLIDNPQTSANNNITEVKPDAIVKLENIEELPDVIESL
ncbi:MAG: HAD family hydrolase [Patescibacteria group bacterium]|nr:HAD family hydrolase [Patescibacteria group bacterium]